MSWSPEQKQAIETRGCNLLVAAAAGSGKTSVLVERIIHSITETGPNGEAPLDVDRMLVVTFTSAAAAEMRARIGSRIASLQKEKPSRHLARQAALLNSSSISTIHAFCQSVVRQYFYLLDIDPGFRVGAAAEMDLLKADVLETVFADCYEADDPEFSLLIDHYADADGDDTLLSLVLNLYEFSRSHPWPSHWLRQLSARFELAESATVDDTPWSELLRQDIRLQIRHRAAAVERLMQEADADPQFSPYAITLAADREVLDELLEAAQTSWAALEKAFCGLKFATLKTVRGGDEERKEYYKSGRDNMKKAITAIRDSYFSRAGTDLIVDMRGLAPLVKALANLVIRFADAFAEAKRKKSVLDFSDLEHFCLRALLDPSSSPGGAKPSPVARELQAKFAEVLVDEYQDTNGVQETILRLVTRETSPNRFMVGDVKQSIYRFRLAEPRLFMEKYRTYPSAGGGDSRRIDLAANFRSRAEVLHAANFLFSQLMTESVAELDYGEAERLNPGLPYPACEHSLAGVELHLMERRPGAEEDQETGEEEAAAEDENADQDSVEEEVSLDAFSREAVWIAGRITELMQAGHQVYDKDTKDYRPLRWRDIVILTRSIQGKAQTLLDILRGAGIPSYADMDSGYFKETEVGIIVSLLQVLDNPRQDIHLAGVMRSPLFGFSGEDLTCIRVADPGTDKNRRDLWDSLGRFCEDKTQEAELRDRVCRLLAALSRWRSLARRRSVAELLWRIYEETGFYDYAGGMPGGSFRQANLRALFDRARQYEATNYRGLFRFLRFIEALTGRGSDLAVARALGENEDVVRVMTIHKSKGLEFPVVFVVDLGKGVNLKDTYKLVLCHRDWGIGPFVTLPQRGYRYPTLARWAIAQAIRRETKAEEMRILYVALTRARERLILVGSARKLAAKCQAWAQTASEPGRHLPEAETAAAKSYLDWIVPAVMRHPDGEPLRQLAEAGGINSPAELAIDTSGCHWQISVDLGQGMKSEAGEASEDSALWQQIRQLQAVPPGEDTDDIRRILHWQYPFEAVTGQSAKLTVTEIKRRVEQDAGEAKQLFASTLHTRPRFIGTKGLSAAQLGTLTHLVMQRIQVNRGVTPEQIGRQIEWMVLSELMLPEEAEAVDREAIAIFFASPLGQRLQRANWVRRELPFSLMLPAERFAPNTAGSGDKVFVQGVLDCLFAEPDGLVLLDYKTDSVDDAGKLADRYAIQLSLYAEAAAAILGQPVKEKYIYSFSCRETVPVF